MKKLLFLDIEATGIDPEDRLVQVAFKEQDNNVVGGLFKAPLPVKLTAMAVNNITNRMLEGMPPFKESQMEGILKERGSSHILVAHNVPYDLGMLKKEGISFDDYICTLKVAHYVDENCQLEKHNLSYLRYYYDIEIEATAHDAIGDILILEQVFLKLFDQLAIIMLNEGSLSGKLDPNEAVIDKMVEISKRPTLFRKFNFGKYNGEFVKDVASGGSDGKGRSWMKWLLGEKINNPSGQEDDWIYTLDYYLKAYEPGQR